MATAVKLEHAQQDYTGKIVLLSTDGERFCLNASRSCKDIT